MKTKILMAFLAVFFLATGSALAIPVVEYTVEGNVLNFSTFNDIENFGISKVGFRIADISENWELPDGVQYAASNGYDWFWIDPYLYGVDRITDILISVTSIPSSVVYSIYIKGDGIYEGQDAIYINNENGLNKYRFDGVATASVPEPMTLIMIGLGILGIARLRKHINK